MYAIIIDIPMNLGKMYDTKKRNGAGYCMIKEIMKEWNIDCKPVQIYHTAWNINDTYVLKGYDNLTALQTNIMIMRILIKEGIPVPKLVKLPDGRDYIEKDSSWYVLTTKLRCRNIVDLKECDEQWFFQLGSILADLHLAFLECQKKISFCNNSLLEEMKGWVRNSIDRFRPEYLDIKDVQEAVRELGEFYDELPKQLIHRDVHLGNFLFEDGMFSGYIDFDLSQSNIRIFDLCYLLLGLLLEEKHPVEEDEWYGIIRQVLSGYDSKMKLTGSEKKAISCVMKNIELLFIAYFLGEGDEKRAINAAELFYLVKNNEVKILDAAQV